jgi:hypothetical protein
MIPPASFDYPQFNVSSHVFRLHTFQSRKLRQLFGELASSDVNCLGSIIHVQIVIQKQAHAEQ